MPPLSRDEAAELVKRRHPAWVEFQEHWRFLFDSYEGGDRYRHADYFRGPFEPWRDPLYAFGWDAETGEGYPFTYNMIVKRNLVPHKSEMSVEGRDMYVLRLNRTPVPAIVELVIRRYLSRIFSQQVKRSAPKPIEGWWLDVDGKGTGITQWVRKTVLPLLVDLGQLDLVFGRPEADPEELEQIRTRADLKRLGLDACIASYILPENMVWWRLSRRDTYAESLVHERDDQGQSYFRHWTDSEANAYTSEGEHLAQKSFVHGLGVVPIVRVFDEKSLRCRNVGRSRMKTIADLQKSIYNRKSELVLNDVQQTHAILQVPEDYCQGDTTVPVGPGGAMPMKKLRNDAGYQESKWLDPPKSGAIECRVHVQDDHDEVLSSAGLLKPAGSTQGATVSQSGVSKSFDVREGNDLLSELAGTCSEAELAAAKMALTVLADGNPSPADLAAIAVEYPREFELLTAADLAVVLSDIQAIAASLGLLPETEAEILKRLISVLLPGLDETRLAELHAEVDAAAASGAAQRDGQREAAADGSNPEVPGRGDQSQAQPRGGTEQNFTQSPSISLPPDAALAVQALNAVLAPEIV